MKKRLDFSDVLALLGMATVTAGLWLISRPLALVGLGAYLFLCSLAAGRSSR